MCTIHVYTCFFVYIMPLFSGFICVLFSLDAAYVIEDAYRKDEQFVDQEVYGTPDYIAPEVILGLPYGN